MRQLMLAHPDTFPAPVHEGSVSIWHLADVLAWLQAREGYTLPPHILEVAQAALQVNVTRESRRLRRVAYRELMALIG